MKVKHGHEVKSSIGLQRVLPFWAHKIEHVRKVMQKHGSTYTYAILPCRDDWDCRVWELWTNQSLTPGLRRRLYNTPGAKRHPEVSRYYREATI